MLIIAKQDNVDNLYAIWDTVTDRFLGVNLGYNECVGMIMGYKNYTYEEARSRVEHPQSFNNISKCIYYDFQPDWAEKEPYSIKIAAMMLASHYKADEYFRNAFIASISSALKDLPKESDLPDVAKKVADRVMGVD